MTPSTSSVPSSPAESTDTPLATTSAIAQETPLTNSPNVHDHIVNPEPTRNTRKRRSPSKTPSSPRAAFLPTLNTRLRTRPATEKSANHPSFVAMIKDALGHSNDPKGPTRSSLKRFIMDKYKPDSNSLDVQFDRAVKGGVRDGIFEYTNRNNTRIRSKVAVVIAECSGGQSSSAQPSVQDAHPGSGSSGSSAEEVAPETVFDARKKGKRGVDKTVEDATSAQSVSPRRPRKQFLGRSGKPIPDNALPLKKRRYDNHNF
ncbi:hypothetical protein EDD21DRAFT_410492 [Dissophora ornata]|nr:hypothetical protein EDD21DRAFT_410492 [Dissophora ornata]